MRFVRAGVTGYGRIGSDLVCFGRCGLIRSGSERYGTVRFVMAGVVGSVRYG
jgi:hypothetical protein